MRLWAVTAAVLCAATQPPFAQTPVTKPPVDKTPLAKAPVAQAQMAQAQAAQPCRLALVLALDVSSSVDETEDALQRGGLANALIAPEVQRALFASPRPVALAAYEWSGRYHQQILLDWQIIDSPDALTQAAAQIGLTPRSHDVFQTAMGQALRFGAQMLGRAPDCDTQVIDMAGDGVNNDDFGPQTAYANPAFDRITVNGLVVNAADFEGEINLIHFFRSDVLHGPGAFIEVADGFADYERAMRRKLERELRPRAVSSLQPTLRQTNLARSQ